MKRKRWTEAELERARGMAPTHTVREIAEALGRPFWGTKAYLRDKGVRGMTREQALDRARNLKGQPAPMTAEQAQAICDGAATKTRAELAAEIGIADWKLRRWAARLGVEFGVARAWKPAEDELLREMAAKGSHAIALRLRRSRRAIVWRAGVLRVPLGDRPHNGTTRAVRVWTPAEDEAIIANARRGYAAIAQELSGRTVIAIAKRARQLGVKVWYWRPGMDANGARRPAAARVKTSTPAAPKQSTFRAVDKAGHTRTVQAESMAAAILARKHGIRPGSPSLLEYCICGAPVWDWEGHYERMGHLRATHLRAMAG